MDAHTIEILVVVTNVLIVVSTIALTKATAEAVHEGHRHEEVETAQIAKIAHEVIEEAEREGALTTHQGAVAGDAVTKIQETADHRVPLTVAGLLS